MKKIISCLWSVPSAIIIASLILSFHYVWINKHDFKIVKHMTRDGVEIDLVMITNKWNGKYCMFNPNSMYGRIRLDNLFIRNCDKGTDKDSYNFKLP